MTSLTESFSSTTHRLLRDYYKLTTTCIKSQLEGCPSVFTFQDFSYSFIQKTVEVYHVTCLYRAFMVHQGPVDTSGELLDLDLQLG